MSKRKVKLQKYKYIVEQRKIKMQNEIGQEVIKLENEIADLKWLVTLNDITNFSVKNIKIFGALLKAITPYAVVTSLVIGGVHFATGSFPFIRDNIKQYKQFSLEYHNGHIDVTENEVDNIKLKSDVCHIKVSSPWKINENGVYERTLYKFNSFHYVEEIYNALIAGNTDYIMEMLENFDSEIETSLYAVSNYDECIIDANVSYIDRESFTISKESYENNLKVTLSFILLSLFIEFDVYLASLMKKGKFKIRLNYINEEYRNKSSKNDELKEELIDKESQLLTLKRKITSYVIKKKKH